LKNALSSPAQDKGADLIYFVNPMASFKKIDNYYIWGIKGIIFLMPLIPLYVTPSMVFPYITGKNFAFRIMVEFAAALWLGLISTNKEYRLRSSPITLSILIFTFIVGLADLFGVNPYKSFWSNYERMEGYITILHLVLYFIIVKSVFRAKRDWKIFFTIFVMVSVLVSFYALIAPQLSIQTSKLAWEYGARVSGTIGNPPFLASYLLLSVFVCFILIVNTQRLSLKFVYLLPVIINSITIYFSASRGAILAAIIGAVILSLFYLLGKSGVSKEKRIKKAVLSVIGILIVLAVAFLTLSDTHLTRHDLTANRFVNIFSDASVQTRFSAWKMAWNGMKERPILGWGQENFIGVYTVNPLPSIMDRIWVDRAHNIVIDWLVNAGLLGLFSYLAVFGTAFYILWTAYQKKRVSKNEALIIATALTVYFIQNLFIFDTINTYLIFFTVLAYIDSIDYSGSATDIDLRNIISKKVKIKSVSAALLALLVFSVGSYYINYRPIRESQLIVRISASSTGIDSYPALLEEFNNALSLETFGDEQLRQGMKSVSYYIISNKRFTQKGALQVVEKTVKELEKEIAAKSYNLEYMTDIINLYREISVVDSSFISRTESLIRECIRINPGYQWLYMSLADVYVLKKDYGSAFNIVQKIADMDPQNDKKQLKLALAAILVSKGDVVSGALENIIKIRMVNNAAAYNKKSYLSFYELYQLAQTYNEAKNFQKALQYYKETINMIPEAIRSGDLAGKRRLEREAGIHFETALVYFAMKDMENALKETQKAAELDPKNFAVGTGKINSLNN
jgi:O-antigen ligase/tetratricopeptide (TPR) repeat protein